MNRDKQVIGIPLFDEHPRSRQHGRAAPPADQPAQGHAGIPAKPPLSEIARSRFVTNVCSNICYVVLNTALMIWYVPFLFHHLGVAAYGMIPLANSLVMFASIISASLDVSINRFLAIDLNQGNDAGANRTFNTALALSLAAGGILLLPAGIVTYLFPVLFNVPAGLELATQFLFASVGITMLAAILGRSFGVASLITHRFDLYNIVRSLTSLSRAGVVALCFLFWPRKPLVCHGRFHRFGMRRPDWRCAGLETVDATAAY